MLFLSQISVTALPEPLSPYAALIFPKENAPLDTAALTALLDMARMDVYTQRREAAEAEPAVSAAVFAHIIRYALCMDAPRHLLSEGLSVLIYYANHNAHGGIFGLCGVEKANKIGYVPKDECAQAEAWTAAAAAVADVVAQIAAHLGYDAEFVENYKRRAESASHNDIEPHAAL